MFVLNAADTPAILYNKGDVYVAGYYSTDASLDVNTIIKFNSLGVKQWETTVDFNLEAIMFAT
jgi:hypothetical protein